MAQNKPKTEQEKHPEDYFNSPAGHIRDRIIINESADIPKGGLFLSLNGFPFLAKTGVEIDLPRPVRLMLDTRIKTENTAVEDERGRMPLQHVSRNIPRITYTIVKLGVNQPDPNIPAPEVIAATEPIKPAEAEIDFP